MTTLTTRPVPAAPPPWSDVSDAIWRRSLAEQHAAMRGDGHEHDEPEEG